MNIVTNKDEKLRLTSKDRDAKFTLSYLPQNTNFKIVKGLNGKGNTISFLLNDGSNRYLHTNDNCCYLYFTKFNEGDKNIINQNKFKNSASFVPLKPNYFKKGYNSFGIVKEHIINNEPVEFLYQLRLRSYFKPMEKIFIKT